MTLFSILSPNAPQYTPDLDLMHAPDTDRTNWSGGGWKKGKGSNPNSALSALTLLAFLFFLNILQSCLKDQIGQNTPIVVMMLPTTAAPEGARHKRDTVLDNSNYKLGETITEPRCQNWTEHEISNLVHSQVELYWNSNKVMPRQMIYKMENTKFDNYFEDINASRTLPINKFQVELKNTFSLDLGKNLKSDTEKVDRLKLRKDEIFP